jgi:hypothetical protein
MVWEATSHPHWITGRRAGGNGDMHALPLWLYFRIFITFLFDFFD